MMGNMYSSVTALAAAMVMGQVRTRSKKMTYQYRVSVTVDTVKTRSNAKEDDLSRLAISRLPDGKWRCGIDADTIP